MDTNGFSENFFIKKCKKIFVKKIKIYGVTWIFAKNHSILDQILIKIIRIRNFSLKEKGKFAISDEKLIDTYSDIINYFIIAIIKIDLNTTNENHNNYKKIIILYEKNIKKIEINIKKYRKKYCIFSINKIFKNIIFLKKKIEILSHFQLKNCYLKMLTDILFFCKKKFQ